MGRLRTNQFVTAAAALALVSAGSVCSANAQPLSFEPGVDFSMGPFASDVLETDDAGMWVHVWSERDTPSSPTGSDSDAFFRVSLDDGRTWGAVNTLNTNAATDSGADYGVRIASDRQGNWIAVWTSEDSLGGTIGTDPDILFATTSDPSIGWSAPAALNADASSDTDADTAPRIDSDEDAEWLVVWSDATSGAQSSSSTDAGANWSSPQSIGATASGALVSDLHGSWVMLNVFSFNGAVSAYTSPDGGATWTSNALDPEPGSKRPDIASSPEGDIVAVWQTRSEFGLDIGSDIDVVGSKSVDGGVTWSAPFALSLVADRSITFGSGFAEDADIFYDRGRDRWVASWTEQGKPFGPDRDIAVAISEDGESWARPFLANSGAAGDNKFSGPAGSNSEHRPTYFASALGGAVLIYQHDSDDAFSASVELECPPIPAAGCRSTITTGASTFNILSRLSGKDSLKWSWRGDATSLSEFGDLDTVENLQLCVYSDEAGSPRLEFEKDVAGGATGCSEGACWSATSKSYRYSDKKLARSSVQRVDLRPGGVGKARIKFLAKKSALGPPQLPLPGIVVVQLINETSGECWEATYSAPKKNSDSKFKARSD